MRLENYPLLGVISHPNQHILGQWFLTGGGGGSHPLSQESLSGGAITYRVENIVLFLGLHQGDGSQVVERCVTEAGPNGAHQVSRLLQLCRDTETTRGDTGR